MVATFLERWLWQFQVLFWKHQPVILTALTSASLRRLPVSDKSTGDVGSFLGQTGAMAAPMPWAAPVTATFPTKRQDFSGSQARETTIEPDRSARARAFGNARVSPSSTCCKIHPSVMPCIIVAVTFS
jgi:hypothetical protein